MSLRFQEFGLRDELLRALDEAGYDTPTPIQEKAIPILLEGHDLIGVAETGTGKTLAFLLPIFQAHRGAGAHVQALVVCPTRELAIQVASEAERFGRHLGVRTVLAYGGTSSGDQKRALAAGVDLVVGTPGRLLDFVSSAWLSLRGVRSVVLDEADRMLDMGFINDVDAILRRSPMSRQTMLFSATIPEQIRRLAERYMLHPHTVKMHRGTKVTEQVDHALYPVRTTQKEALLLEVLRRERPAKTLIFTATRENTSALALALRRHGHEVLSLSSLLSQPNRERALAAFRRGEFPVLVATDVAARGLDITDIDLVVNFDVPMHAEDYVHRIGRTGRAERTGKAATLVSELDGRRVAEIERLLGYEVPRVELDGFAYERRPAARRSEGGGRFRGRRAPGGGRRPRGKRTGRGRSGPGGRRRGSSG
jgi:superfamily II DNA/RNA helicase